MKWRPVLLALLLAGLGGCAAPERGAPPAAHEAASSTLEADAVPSVPTAEAAPSAPESEAASSAPEPVGDEPPLLTLRTPLEFASCRFSEAYPRHEGNTLTLELLSGSYDREEAMWSSAWSGNFQFRYSRGSPSEPSGEAADVLSSPLELRFNEPFALSVDDYNQDGKPDFVLTQFGSMTGGDYGAIFTVNDDGTVEPLPIRTGLTRYISMLGTIRSQKEGAEAENEVFLFPYTHVGYSPGLCKNGENGFTVTYPAIHGLEYVILDEEQLRRWTEEHPELSLASVADVYQWREDAFVLVRQEIRE